MRSYTSAPNRNTSTWAESPWAHSTVGICLFAIGIWTFFQLAGMEQGGDSIRLHWILLIAYTLLGKFGVMSLICSLGAWLTFSGVKQLISRQA